MILGMLFMVIPSCAQSSTSVNVDIRVKGEAGPAASDQGPDTSSPDTSSPDEEHPEDPPEGEGCEDPPAVDADTSFEALLGRLNDQGCLHQSDMDAAEVHMQERLLSPVYCDEVWRLQLSPDGTTLQEPEWVMSHASVPDLLVLPDGSHLLVYNHLQTEIFMDTLRTDPARFWRQGLIGFGGVGISIDQMDGNGPVEITELDLRLDHLNQAVDPDLGWTTDGQLRLLWYGIPAEVMRLGITSPMASPKPHRLYRTVMEEQWRFEQPVVAVESYAGSTGGVDPTVLSLADGSEVIYMGPMDHYAHGWHSTDLVSWPLDPDIDTTIPAVTPDAHPDPAGGYRMFFMKNGELGAFKYQWSADGLTWDEDMQPLIDIEDGHNLTVDFDADGNLWLYYNLLNADCLEEIGWERR